jgi:hypothetical protein
MVPVLASLLLSAAQAADPFDLVPAGALLDQAAAAALRPSQGNWVALVAEPGGLFALREVRPQLRPADDPLDEGNEALLLSAELNGEGLVFLRGRTPLSLGAVPTTLPEATWTTYEEPVVLSSGEGTLTRLLTRPFGPEASRVELLRTRTGAGRRQILAEEARGTPVVRWAGDLDADGAPDLLLEVDPGSGAELRLYLSSAAAPGEIAGLAGRFLIPGC